MRRIKLTGREHCVVKAIGFADAMAGAELEERTHMQPDDLTDTLNALLAAGFIESKPYHEHIAVAEMSAIEFEVNPAYVHELRSAMVRSF